MPESPNCPLAVAILARFRLNLKVMTEHASSAAASTSSTPIAAAADPISRSEASLYSRISSSARHCVEAATGYWELGMSIETLREIRELAANPDPAVAMIAREPHVQRFLLMAFMDLGLWASALSVADGLDEVVRLHDEFSDIPLKAAFCLHELGRTRDARQCLYDAPQASRDNALYYYDLACYECRLGQHDPAARLLTEALRRDATLHTLLAEDANLASIRHLVTSVG